jgi:hypothetical protein
LPKLRLVGDRLATLEIPVPLRLAVCGLPAALSVTLTVPLRDPVAVGVKVTWIVQLPPAGRLLPQVLVWAKSPLAAMPLIASVVALLLVSVNVCAALVVPMF